MKQKLGMILLAAEAALCAALAFAQTSTIGAASAFAFPFWQIGAGLRALSLSGGAGNALALALYALICLLPLAAQAVFAKKRGLYKEDWLLMPLSAMLFVTLYIMINPALIGSLFNPLVPQDIAKATLAIITDSIAIGYGVLRVLRLFAKAEIRKVGRYLCMMLGALNALLIYLAFGAELKALLDAIASLKASNIGTEDSLGVTYAFLVLQFFVNALPHLMNILVVQSLIRLIHAMRESRYSAETVRAAEGAARLCSTVLAITTLSSIAFNLLQLICASSLRTINTTAQFPVLSIVLVLFALLLSRLVADGKRLNDENEQFI